MSRPEDIIEYWYSDRIRKHWFASTPELDNEIRKNYQAIWLDAANGKYNSWMDTPIGCLALTIILDQFPLNMFRGQEKSFSTERNSIDVARQAIEVGHDKHINKGQVAFLYMPLMHSENLTDQDFAVALFEQAKLEDNLKFAQHHRDIIRQFGRFPHRNKILGRENTAQEIEYLASRDAFTG